MNLYSVDINFIGKKTPETLTIGNMKNILEHLDGFKHRCSIKFKSTTDLNECSEYLINYTKEQLNENINSRIINGNILTLFTDKSKDGGKIC